MAFGWLLLGSFSIQFVSCFSFIYVFLHNWMILLSWLLGAERWGEGMHINLPVTMAFCVQFWIYWKHQHRRVGVFIEDNSLAVIDSVHQWPTAPRSIAKSHNKFPFPQANLTYSKILIIPALLSRSRARDLLSICICFSKSVDRFFLICLYFRELVRHYCQC